MTDNQGSLFPLSVDLEREGTVVFRDQQELLGWVERERTAWKWASKRTNAPQAERFFNVARNRWQSVENSVRSLFQAGKGSSPSLSQTAIAQAFSQLRGGPMLISTSERGRFVMSLAESEPGLALATALALMRVSSEPNDPWSALGAVEARLFELKLLEASPDHLRARIQAIHGEFESLLQSSTETARDSAKAFRDAVVALNGAEESFVESLRQYELGFPIRLALLGNQLEDKVKELEKKYQAAMALREPVKYWTARRRESEKWAVRYRTAFYLGIGVALVSLIKLYPSLAEGKPTIEDTLHLFLLATPVVWLLRVLSKLAMVNLNVAVDAGERETLTQVYLAMLTEGAVADDHRAIILKAIARRTSPGLLPDDTASTGPAGEFFKAVTGKQ